jgi:WD40 repeat protein
MVAVLGKERDKGPFAALAVSPDGKWLASAADRTVYLWRTGQTEKAASLTEHPGPVLALAFDPDSTSLVVGGAHLVEGGGWLQVWKIEAEAVVAGLSLLEMPAIQTLAFVPGSGLLAVGGAPAVRVQPDGVKENLPDLHRLQLRRLTRDCCEHVTNLGDGTQPIDALAVAPDGGALAAVTANGTLQVWNLAPESAPPGLLWGAMGLLAVAGVGVLAWPRLAERRRFRLAGRLGTGLIVIGLVLCGTLWVATALSNPLTRLAIQPDQPSHCRAVAFSADGQLLAVGGHDKVRLWRREWSGFREIEPITGHKGNVTSVGFASVGPWLTSLDESGGFQVTHLPSRRCVCSDRVSPAKTNRLIVSPDGRHAVVGGADRSMIVLRWWNRDGTDRRLLEANAALARNPEDSAALQKRAQEYLRRGRLKSALADLDAAAKVAPSKETYWLRALTHAGLSISEGRREDPEVVLADRNRPAEWVELDRRAARRWYRDLALADLARVIKMDPYDALAHYQRGLLLMQREDYRNARRSLDLAFCLNPDLARAVAASQKEKDQ